MTGQGGNARGGPAILMAIAAAVAGYIPSMFVYDRVSLWLHPMRHAEEAMGRGMEMLFIVGPVGALSLAAIVGVVTYRSTSCHVVRIAMAFIAVCALASLLLTQLPGFL